MDIQAIRRAVLRALITKNHDGIARQFALTVKKPDGQINDMLSDPPRKSFGERIARALEQKYSPPLPTGYFDDIRNADGQSEPVAKEPSNIVYGQFNAAISEVIGLMESLNDDEQREVVGAVRLLHNQAQAKRQNSTQRVG